MKKFVTILLAVILFFSAIPTVSAKAENTQPIIATPSILKSIMDIEDVVKVNPSKEFVSYMVNIDSFSESEIASLSAAGITVFVAGTLAAWIIDGVLILATGQDGGAWAAEAMRWAGSEVKEVMISYVYGAPTSYGVSSTGCIQKRPGDPWLCPTRGDI